MTFSRYIDCDLESQAYAVHLIAEVMAASCDPETRRRAVRAILNDDGAIDASMEIWSDGEVTVEAFTIPDMGVQFSIAMNSRNGNERVDSERTAQRSKPETLNLELVQISSKEHQSDGIRLSRTWRRPLTLSKCQQLKETLSGNTLWP
jgi:hypothetical protein